MSVHYFNQDINFKLPQKRKLSNWIKDIISYYGFNYGEISYIFTDNSNILSINKQFLNHDYYTDIITFNYNNNKILSGDIYISIDTVRSNAKFYNTPFYTELYRVMIHGILHLIGFNDKTEIEKSKMTENEDFCLYLLFTKFQGI